MSCIRRIAVLVLAGGFTSMNVAAEATSGPTVVEEQDTAGQAIDIVLGTGETLLGSLSAIGVSARDAHAATRELAEVLNARTLAAGTPLRIWRSRNEHAKGDKQCLTRLEIVPELDRLVTVTHTADGTFQAVEVPIEHERRTVIAAGQIASTLYEGVVERQVPSEVWRPLFLLLGHAIDLQRELRRNDRFRLVYELFRDERDGKEHAGTLLFAELKRQTDTIQAWRYRDSRGTVGYFDAQGRSVQTTLMRTPVDGARLTSRFGRRRHPVLGYTRAHRGLDFGAPRGTPVYAAGNGIVKQRARLGSFGRYVRLRHGGGYETAYAHLSRYAKGLSVGEKVSQGQVIGYVGASGVTTGPNLHYEVLSRGNQVDPLRLNLPPGRQLAGRELTRFQQVRATLDAQLARASPSDNGAVALR